MRDWIKEGEKHKSYTSGRYLGKIMERETIQRNNIKKQERVRYERDTREIKHKCDCQRIILRYIGSINKDGKNITSL